MSKEIKLTLNFFHYINEKLNKETSPSDIIRLQNNYIRELETELLPLRTKPIISRIIEYDQEHDLIIESIENDLTPQYEPVHIENIREIEEFLVKSELLAEELRSFADQIDDTCEEIKYDIENITFNW